MKVSQQIEYETTEIEAISGTMQTLITCAFDLGRLMVQNHHELGLQEIELKNRQIAIQERALKHQQERELLNMEQHPDAIWALQRENNDGK